MELQKFSKKEKGGLDWLKLDWVGKLSGKEYSKTTIPSPLKGLEMSPTNVPFGRVTGTFTGNDDLRPVMMYVNYDKENDAIVGTDAHSLLHLTPKPFPPYEGLFLTPQKIAYYEKRGINVGITSKFPNYQPIIPKIGVITKDIDTQKLYWYANSLSKLKIEYTDEKLKRKIGYVPYLGYQQTITLRYKLGVNQLGGEGDYMYISINALMLASNLKAFFMLGSDNLQNDVNKVNLLNNTNNRALVFNYNRNDFVGEMPLKEFNGFIQMPLMRDSGVMNIGNLDFKDDMPLTNLIYDLNENKIFSNGKLYDIGESLGFKYKKDKSDLSLNTKNNVNKQKNTSKSSNLAKRLKGLKLLLKTKPNDTLIKKRIKGLSMLLNDDLPF